MSKPELIENDPGSNPVARDVPALGPISLHLRKWPSSDESVFDQVLIKENYKPLIDLVRASNQAANIHTILDGGANIGCTAIYFSKLFPLAEILCVEPDTDNFIQLEKNIRANGLTKVVPLKAGVWSTQQALKVDPRFRDGREWARSVYEHDAGTVPGFSLSDLMRRQGWNGIDILKLDVEGAERTIFANREDALAILSRVKFIAIEIHDEFNCRAAIEEILLSASFILSKHDELTLGAKNP